MMHQVWLGVFFGNEKISIEMVPGIDILSIEKAAIFFGLNILVYEPREVTIDDTKDYSWHLVGSYGKGGECRIGIQNGHCFYIKDIERLAKVWKCVNCGQEFNDVHNYGRHLKTPCSSEPKIICTDSKVTRKKSSSERVFNGSNYSKIACEWINEESERLGVHIYHALCGHGGERKIPVKLNREGKVVKSFKVDGLEPILGKVFEFNGCWAQGCPCNPRNYNEEKYEMALSKENEIREAGYELRVKWEHDYFPVYKFGKEMKHAFVQYPGFIVYDFE